MQWFSNFSGIAGPYLKVFWFRRSRWGPETFVSGKFPAMLILLVWGPCFENYSSDVPCSSACVPYTWPQGPLSAVYLSVLVHMCLYSWYTGLLSGHGTDQACSHLRVVAWNVFPGCFKRPAPSTSAQLHLSQPWLAMSYHHLHLSLSHHLLLCSLISLFSPPWRMQSFPFSVGEWKMLKSARRWDWEETKPGAPFEWLTFMREDSMSQGRWLLCFCRWSGYVIRHLKPAIFQYVMNFFPAIKVTTSYLLCHFSQNGSCLRKWLCTLEDPEWMARKYHVWWTFLTIQICVIDF